VSDVLGVRRKLEYGRKSEENHYYDFKTIRNQRRSLNENTNL
jgi:hypothetical protein